MRVRAALAAQATEGRTKAFACVRSGQLIGALVRNREQPFRRRVINDGRPDVSLHRWWQRLLQLSAAPLGLTPSLAGRGDQLRAWRPHAWLRKQLCPRHQEGAAAGSGNSFVIARVRLPTAPPQVKHVVGAPLTFKVSVNGKRALSPGVVTLLGGSSSKVAKEVATAAAT